MDWGAIEADFTRFYQTDLRHACWGPGGWGCRRLLTHIEGLPFESAFARKRRGSRAGWSQESEILAAAVDELSAIRYYTGASVGAKGDPPEAFPRPETPDTYEVEPVAPQTVSMAEFFNMMKE